MKKLFLIITIVGGLVACNGNGNNNGNNDSIPNHSIRDSVRNPLTVQPESADIPKDMTIQKDSVVVPDSPAMKR